MAEAYAASTPEHSGASTPSFRMGAGQRDMKAELQRWKEEKAARQRAEREERAQKQRQQPDFKVPRRTAASENAPCAAPGSVTKARPAPAKKVVASAARAVLGERSPNIGSTSPQLGNRSVSPPLARQLYKPNPRPCAREMAKSEVAKPSAPGSRNASPTLARPCAKEAAKTEGARPSAAPGRRNASPTLARPAGSRNTSPTLARPAAASANTALSSAVAAPARQSAEAPSLVEAARKTFADTQHVILGTPATTPDEEAPEVPSAVEAIQHDCGCGATRVIAEAPPRELTERTPPRELTQNLDAKEADVGVEPDADSEATPRSCSAVACEAAEDRTSLVEAIEHDCAAGATNELADTAARTPPRELTQSVDAKEADVAVEPGMDAVEATLSAETPSRWRSLIDCEATEVVKALELDCAATATHEIAEQVAATPPSAAELSPRMETDDAVEAEMDAVEAFASATPPVAEEDEEVQSSSELVARTSQEASGATPTREAELSPSKAALTEMPGMEAAEAPKVADEVTNSSEGAYFLEDSDSHSERDGEDSPEAQRLVLPLGSAPTSPAPAPAPPGLLASLAPPLPPGAPPELPTEDPPELPPLPAAPLNDAAEVHVEAPREHEQSPSPSSASIPRRHLDATATSPSSADVATNSVSDNGGQLADYLPSGVMVTAVEGSPEHRPTPKLEPEYSAVNRSFSITPARDRCATPVPSPWASGPALGSARCGPDPPVAANLADYLPAVPPVPSCSSTTMAPAFSPSEYRQEMAALVRVPPPSPAEPSAAVAYALSLMAEQQEAAKASEIARTIDAVSDRLASEVPFSPTPQRTLAFNDVAPAHGSAPGSPVVQLARACSPAQSLSPLSLESVGQSPERAL